MEGYKPFSSEGFVSPKGANAPLTPDKILRDAGATQTLLLADVLPLVEETSSGQSILIQGVQCGFVNVPLHHINSKSDIVSGPVIVGIRTSLPVEGVQLMLGNDLAINVNHNVVVSTLLTSTRSDEKVIDPIEQESHDLYPAYAVTRAMAKKALLIKKPVSILVLTLI